MKYHRTRDQKPRIYCSHGDWRAASAWDVDDNDHETWRLNSEAGRFAAHLNGTVVRCIITRAAHPYEGRERAYARVAGAQP